MSSFSGAAIEHYFNLQIVSLYPDIQNTLFQSIDFIPVSRHIKHTISIYRFYSCIQTYRTHYFNLQIVSLYPDIQNTQFQSIDCIPVSRHIEHTTSIYRLYPCIQTYRTRYFNIYRLYPCIQTYRTHYFNLKIVSLYPDIQNTLF